MRDEKVQEICENGNFWFVVAKLRWWGFVPKAGNRPEIRKWKENFERVAAHERASATPHNPPSHEKVFAWKGHLKQHHTHWGTFSDEVLWLCGFLYAFLMSFRYALLRSWIHFVRELNALFVMTSHGGGESRGFLFIIITTCWVLVEMHFHSCIVRGWKAIFLLFLFHKAALEKTDGKKIRDTKLKKNEINASRLMVEGSVALYLVTISDVYSSWEKNQCESGAGATNCFNFIITPAPTWKWPQNFIAKYCFRQYVSKFQLTPSKHGLD